MYDAEIGRFTGVDPLADILENNSWSSFTYVWNNPLLFIDPDGRTGQSHHVDEDGNTIVHIDDGDDGVYQHANGTTAAEIYTNTYGANSQFGSVGTYLGEAHELLDPNTLNANIFDQHYPGPNNPTTYPNSKGEVLPIYSVPPVNWSGIPALIHDQEYDIVGAQGASGLFFDHRTIGADWRFVAHELVIADQARMTGQPGVMLKSLTLGIGLGIAAFPKTAIAYSSPTTTFQSVFWGRMSKMGVK